MKLKDILSVKGPAVYTIHPEATLADVADAMVSQKCGSLVVAHEGRMVGIITERDFLNSYVSTRTDLSELLVSDFMSTNVITGTPDDSVSETMGLLTRKRIRHLPIVDEEGGLLGMISIGDVVKAQHDQLSVENHFMKSYIQEVPVT